MVAESTESRLLTFQNLSEVEHDTEEAFGSRRGLAMDIMYRF